MLFAIKLAHLFQLRYAEYHDNLGLDEVKKEHNKVSTLVRDPVHKRKKQTKSKKCSICHFIFLHEEALGLHMKNIHNVDEDKKPFKENEHPVNGQSFSEPSTNENCNNIEQSINEQNSFHKDPEVSMTELDTNEANDIDNTTTDGNLERDI